MIFILKKKAGAEKVAEATSSTSPKMGADAGAGGGGQGLDFFFFFFAFWNGRWLIYWLLQIPSGQPVAPVAESKF